MLAAILEGAHGALGVRRHEADHVHHAIPLAGALHLLLKGGMVRAVERDRGHSALKGDAAEAGIAPAAIGVPHLIAARL